MFFANQLCLCTSRAKCSFKLSWTLSDLDQTLDKEYEKQCYPVPGFVRQGTLLSCAMYDAYLASDPANRCGCCKGSCTASRSVVFASASAPISPNPEPASCGETTSLSSRRSKALLHRIWLLKPSPELFCICRPYHMASSRSCMFPARACSRVLTGHGHITWLPPCLSVVAMISAYNCSLCNITSPRMHHVALTRLPTR